MAPIDSVKLVKFVLIDVNSFPDYRLDRIIDERNRIVAPLSLRYIILRLLQFHSCAYHGFILRERG